jgi:hypothetical protein
MKNKNKYIILTVSLLSVLFLSSCYQNTIDALSSFKFQLAILFDSQYRNKFAPDTTIDFVNLDDYKQYRDNKDRIKKAQFIQFNYWIDSLHLANNKPFNPKTDNVEFEFIKFYLVFQEGGQMPSDPGKRYLLGTFNNVNVANYYRNPEHILVVPEDVAKIIEEAVKINPRFYIVSEYSKVKGQQGPKESFPFIWARFDIAIRFEVSL